MQPEQVVDALRPLLSGALIATDFDGTLAPIVRDPDSSRPVDGAVPALAALADRGARISLITGRDARTVVRLGGFDAIPGVLVEGLYGLEQWTAGELHSPDVPPEIEQLRRSMPDWLAEHGADEGVWVEDKRLSLVVHTRRTADPASALRRLQEPAEQLAAQLGIELHTGRDVLEFRLPGYDKGGALRRLVDQLEPAAVLFAGDDVGDLPAFAMIAQLRAGGMPAWSIAAASAEIPEVADAADVTVDGPDGVVAVLRALSS